MSNLKIERARKLDLGDREMTREGQGGRHRGRAASCTEGSFFNYRRQVISSGKTDSAQNACSSTNKLSNSVANSVSNCSSTNASFSTANVFSNNNCKRKYSCDVKSLGTGPSGAGFNKRRKKESTMIPPTKFLLGGNINDPLNLNSFMDEKLGTPIPQFTPHSSPMPIPKHRQQVEVLIPPNINDPLNLNGGEEAGDLELDLVSPKAKKRKRANKRKKTSSLSESTNTQVENVKSECETAVTNNVSESKSLEVAVPPQTLSLSTVSHKSKRSSGGDKIVSPVIPQPTSLMTRKRFSSGHLKSLQLSTQTGETSANNVGVAGKVHQRKRQQQQQQQAQQKARKRNHDQFIYGNYNRYYGYRNPDSGVDPRVECLKKEWFEGKDVLDVGCNIGHVTFCVARELNPKKIIGLDIDQSLIKRARKNVVHYLKKDEGKSTCGGGGGFGQNQFPISLPICHGPIATSLVRKGEINPAFPNNVCFVQCNYVPKSEEILEDQREEFDVILCLSLTKWVHLNWGDLGLKRLFKRMFKQLRPGGKLLLEAQAWSSYTRKKKLSEETMKNYKEIQLQPENFSTYLLSKEVGFSTCEVVGIPFNQSKGFRRPIQLFTKSGEKSSPKLLQEEFKEG